MSARDGDAALETRIAVRAYAPRVRDKPEPRVYDAARLALVLDTETRTDHAQALLFGSYQIREVGGKLRQEGLVHGEVTAAELEILERYVADQSAANGGHLRLHSRRTFLREVLWPIAYKSRARVVGFNLPFDLSRLAYAWGRARDGGFRLELFESVDKDGRVWPDRYRPAVRIKTISSRQQFISFVAPATLDADAREDGRVYRGRFLDLHMLAYALSDKSLSLDRAARKFGLEVGKGTVEEHGILNPEYIDYNRLDVEVTWALHQALVAEWDRHPIVLAPEQGYSAAAIGKAYLAAAGIRPPAEHSDVEPARLGQAMTTFFGGRTEVRIRRAPVPVRYVDFASMYPTIFALLRLWDWVIAGRLAATDATEDSQTILATLDRAALHDPAVWPRLAGVFCRIRPQGELLPVRAQYAGSLDLGRDEATATGSAAWTIGLNRLEAEPDLWFSLADLLVAKLLGGAVPEVLEAFRVVPVAAAAGLAPIKLRGSIAVDPRVDDLFRLATEERARTKANKRMPMYERERLGQFLKTLANGGAYGIFAEVRQLDPVPGGTDVRVDGLWPIEAHVATPEEPGAYCFPPLAAAVIAAARLLLALLQSEVEARGGTYVACDTDSLVIVSSEVGGLVACPYGTARLPDGRPAIRALSWGEVAEVLAGLESLNPYAPGTVPALIKLEAENLGREEQRPVELRALAISAKRYVLYERHGDQIVIRKASWHGFGLYRNPLPKRGAGARRWEHPWPEWVDVVWRRFIAEAEGQPVGPEPDWFALPAVGQLPVSSPAVLRPFTAVNAGKPYEEQVKPFGFLLLGHVDPLAPLPDGLTDVTPMAPFTDDPAKLLSLPWRNRRDGRPLAVTTRPGGVRGKVRLATIGDVVRDYRLHPEAKSGDGRGGLGRRGSAGVLPRLTVRAVGLPAHIGKESNRLEDVQDGLITHPNDVYVEYRDERREWEIVLPALRRLRDERGWRRLAEASGLSERELRYVLNGGKVPRPDARRRLLAVSADG